MRHLHAIKRILTHKKASRCYTCCRTRCAWRYKPETFKGECTPSK